MMIRPFQNKTPQIADSVFVADTALVIGDVHIGADSSIWFGSILRGDIHYIRIGERTNLQDMCMVHVTGGRHPTVVGNEVTVGHSVTLHGCEIRDRCLVGVGAIVLDGAVVGENCIVTAGALVPPNVEIPPRSLAMGVPARVRRELTAEEVKSIAESAERYVSYAQQYQRQVLAW